MGQQEFRRSAALEAHQALHGAKHVDHRLGLVAGAGHGLQADAVGLFLVATRVAKLVLDHRRLAAGQGRDAGVTGAAGGQDQARQHGGHGRHLGLLGACLATGVVAL